MKAIITVGMSGSGKSTWAKDEVSERWPNVVMTNRDELRWQVSGVTGWEAYRFTSAKEEEVTINQRLEISRAASEGKDIIIADTNLNPIIRSALILYCEGLGYEVELRDFPMPSLEEAWKRDRFRGEFAVGREVLYKQWQQWLDYIGYKRYTPNPKLPKAVIFDIDGTLAHMNGKRGAFEWNKVLVDDVDEIVSDVSFLLSQNEIDSRRVIIVSGRDSVCREDTEHWLKGNAINYHEIFMRPEGDMRKDRVIKEEIFWRDIAPFYNVEAVFDDRPQVVRMWYDLKIPKVFSVGNPWIEF